jgi:hypothetical protein
MSPSELGRIQKYCMPDPPSVTLLTYPHSVTLKFSTFLIRLSQKLIGSN